MKHNLMITISALAVVFVLGFILYLLLGRGLLKGEREWYEMIDYAVFSSAQAETQTVSRGKDAEFFTPSTAEIQKAEELFRKEIPDFDTYYRQYYGTRSLVDKNRVINLRAVSKSQVSEFPAWRTQLLMVLDGGDAFIDGTANLDTDLVLFSPHGES